MHESSYNEMKQFVDRYLDRGKPLSILDVGSLDVNGSYKPLFDNQKWTYTGVDLAPGMNVDIVSEDPYTYPFENGAFDVVISGSVLEHVEDTHAFIRECGRVLKKTGVMCVIAPWTYPEHKYPQDCWRILPDGMRFLMEKMAGIRVLNIHKNETDCVGIAGALQRDIKASFGVLVNDLQRLDMCLRQSVLPGKMHFLNSPESAVMGLNSLLRTMEDEGADVGILTHQDMSYGQGWLDQVKAQVTGLPDSWTVAGIIGKDLRGRICGKLQDTRIAPLFDTSDIHDFPHPAACFDECCIIVNLKKGFRFDERLTGYDLYGTLCVLQTWEMGGTAWIIDAYARHHCMRPFSWIPDDLFCRNFKWLYDTFPKAARIDSTAIGGLESDTNTNQGGLEDG